MGFLQVEINRIVQLAWDNCGVHIQAFILTYDQVREYDETEREAQLAGARMPGSAAEPARRRMLLIMKSTSAVNP
ncbi:MAG: hypothetical protein JW719_11525 [Pirellulales bacterium]|nr:hypothetical protein [Pirellulales bacterium]